MAVRGQQASSANTQELDFSQPVVNIGSHPENDIKLLGSGVLPFHLTVVSQDGKYNLIPLSADAQILQAGKLLDVSAALSLAENEAIQIGAYTLFFRPNGSPTSLHVVVSQAQTGQGPAASTAEFENAILVNAATQQAEADVDQSVSYELEIINAGPIVASFFINMQGLPEDWVEIRPDVLNLNENQRASVTVTVTAPRTPASSAGKHPFEIAVSSPNYPGHRNVVPLGLIIHPYYEFALGNLTPKQQRIPWRKRIGKVTLPIINRGNSAADFNVAALDDENGCSFDFQVSSDTQLTRQATMNVKAGETLALPIEITPIKRPILAMGGKRYQYTTTVQVAQQTTAPQVVSGSVTSYPLFGWWSIVLGIAAILLGLFILLQPRIQSFEVAANKDVIELGDTTKLVWSVSPFATRLNISNLDQAISYGQTSQSIAPKQSTTYEFVAGNWLSGLMGLDQKKIKTVLVVPPAPVINVFTVDSTSVARGKSTTIRWSVSQADKAILTIAGVVYELTPDKFSGEQTIALAKDSLVTMEARNASGSELRSYYINVVDPNVVINKFIVWVRPPASAALIPSLPTLAGAAGDQFVSFALPKPGAYALRHAPAGSTAPLAADNFTVKYVELVPDKASDNGYRVEFYHPERQLSKGEQVMIEWSVDGTDTNTVQIAPFTDNLPTIGRQPFFPQASMNFVMTATSGDQKKLFMLPVTVFDGTPPTAPKIDIYKASPTSQKGPVDVQFAWSVSGNWTRVQLLNGKGVVADYLNPQGFKTVKVSKSDTFILTAWNGKLSSSAAVDITIDPALISTPLVITGVYPNTGKFVTRDKISITVDFPSLPKTTPPTPAPTGNIIISDGTSSCTFVLPVKTCDLIFTTPGLKSLVASYAGDGKFYQQVESDPYPPLPNKIVVTSATVTMAPKYFTLNTGTTPPSAGTFIADITQNPLQLDAALFIKVDVKPVSTILPVDQNSKIKFSICDQDAAANVDLSTCKLITEIIVTVDPSGNSGSAGIILPNFPVAYLSVGTRAFLFEYHHTSDALIPANLIQKNISFARMGLSLSLPVCADPVKFSGCIVSGTSSAPSNITFDINKAADGTPLSTLLPTPQSLFKVLDDGGSGGTPSHLWTCAVIQKSDGTNSFYKLDCTTQLPLISTALFTFDNSSSQNYSMGATQPPLFSGPPFTLIRKTPTRVSLDPISAIVGQTVTLTSTGGGAGAVHLLDINGQPILGADTNKLTLTASDGTFLGVANPSGSTCLLNGNVITIFSISTSCQMYFKKQGSVSLTVNFLGDGNYFPSASSGVSVPVAKQTGITTNWKYLKSANTYVDWDITSWKPNTPLNVRVILGGPTGFAMDSLLGQTLNLPLKITKNPNPPANGTCNGGLDQAFPLTISKVGSDYVADFAMNCSKTQMEILLGSVAIGDGSNFAFAPAQIVSRSIVIADRPTVNLTVSIKRVADSDETVIATGASSSLKTIYAGEAYKVQFTVGTLFADAFDPNTTIQGSMDYYQNNAKIQISLPSELTSRVDWSASDCQSSAGSHDLLVNLNATPKVLNDYGYPANGQGIHDIQISNTACTLVFGLDPATSYQNIDPTTAVTFTLKPTPLYAPNYGTNLSYSVTQSYSMQGVHRQAVSAVFSPQYFSTSSTPLITAVYGGPDQTISMTLTRGSGINNSSLFPLDPTAAYDGQVSLTFPTCGTLNILSPGAISSASVATTILHTPVDNTATCTGTAISMKYAGNPWFLPLSGNASLNFVSAPATSTTLTISPGATLQFGTSLTFSATVASTAGTPTGSIQFMDGTTALSGKIALTAGSASYTSATLAVGGHSITADYTSDNVTGFAPSNSSPSPVTITLAATNTTLSSNPSVWTTSAPVTFTATVTRQSGAGVPSGSVDFLDGTTTMGTVTLDSGGVAQFTTTFTTGIHAIKAVYGGSSGYITSTSLTLTENVTLATSITLVSNNQPPTYTYGDAEIFTATVKYTAAQPTGTVVFNDGASSIGSVTLNGTESGVAKLTASPTLAAGSHSITATYTPDAASPYSTSTSGSLTVTVNQAASSISIVSSASTSVYGVSVSFTASVPASLGGTVQFWDGATALGTVNASGGSASFATATLSVAGSPHSIAAVFTPTDTNYAKSISNTLTQTVTPAAPTITIVSLDAPAQSSTAPLATDNLSLSVVVSVSPGMSTPFGTVEFFTTGAAGISQSLGKVSILAGSGASVTLTFSLVGTAASPVTLSPPAAYTVWAVYTPASGSNYSSVNSPAPHLVITTH